jgi:tetrahydromethanopterin S-methyltransferase subunit A
MLGSTARLRTSLVAERYECLGCAPCWPAEALGLLADAGMTDAGASCPTDVPNERPGWPALPGAYTVLRWAAPVGVCTLNDADLAERVAATANPHIAIVGTLATENLGIERLVRNVLTNPNLRFVVLAGPDTRQAVGHLPGASLLALAARGVDERGRIIGAPGRRAVLRNVTSAEIEAFRTTVEVIDLRDVQDTTAIDAAVRDAAARNPGPIERPAAPSRLSPTEGYVPARMTADPAGYFVIYPDKSRDLLVLEHYRTDDVLDSLIEGRTPAECYTAAIDADLLSRLDHAAYLGRELARAEAGLRGGPSYTQDAAPEHPTATACSADACSDSACHN